MKNRIQMNRVPWQRVALFLSLLLYAPGIHGAPNRNEATRDWVLLKNCSWSFPLPPDFMVLPGKKHPRNSTPAGYAYESRRNANLPVIIRTRAFRNKKRGKSEPDILVQSFCYRNKERVSRLPEIKAQAAAGWNRLANPEVLDLGPRGKALIYRINRKLPVLRDRLASYLAHRDLVYSLTLVLPENPPVRFRESLKYMLRNSRFASGAQAAPDENYFFALLRIAAFPFFLLLGLIGLVAFLIIKKSKRQ